jgi:hypothetical protein
MKPRSKTTWLLSILVETSLTTAFVGDNTLILSQFVHGYLPFSVYSPNIGKVPVADATADFAGTQGFIYGFGLTSATGISTNYRDGNL